MGIVKSEINANGELVLTYTSDNSVTLGKVEDKDGESAYEIYIKNHPRYVGTEEEWMEDLVNGNLVTVKVTIIYNLAGGNIASQTSYIQEVTKVVM